MKKMKKIIRKLVMIIFLIMYCISNDDAALAAPSTWAENDVVQAIELGLVPNQLQDNYQNNITREQFCDLVVKVFEEYTGKSADEILQNLDISIVDKVFSDTNSKNVSTCYMLGIINGRSSTTFDPNV